MARAKLLKGQVPILDAFLSALEREFFQTSS